MDESESAVTLESEVTLCVVLEQDVPVRFTADVVVDAEELEQLTAGGIEQLALEQALKQAAHASDVVDAWGREADVGVGGFAFRPQPSSSAWRLLSITDDADTEY